MSNPEKASLFVILFLVPVSISLTLDLDHSNYGVEFITRWVLTGMFFGPATYIIVWVWCYFLSFFQTKEEDVDEESCDEDSYEEDAGYTINLIEFTTCNIFQIIIHNTDWKSYEKDADGLLNEIYAYVVNLNRFAMIKTSAITELDTLIINKLDNTEYATSQLVDEYNENYSIYEEIFYKTPSFLSYVLSEDSSFKEQNVLQIVSTLINCLGGLEGLRSGDLESVEHDDIDYVDLLDQEGREISEVFNKTCEIVPEEEADRICTQTFSELTKYFDDMELLLSFNSDNWLSENVDYERYYDSQNIPSSLQSKTAREQPVTHTKELRESDSYLKVLEEMIGLQKVKTDVKTLVNTINVNEKRKRLGLKQIKPTLHMVFAGNPGTGKTTVARLIGQIYKSLGVLTKGHFIEADSSKLIGEYLGQTAIKTTELVESAIGGVLFIDEAYSLTGKDYDDYGEEAISTLLKLMEDNRDDLVVIVAGYTEEMEAFLKSNTGLKSRFNKNIHFQDYSVKELLEIFKTMCKENDFIFENSLIDTLEITLKNHKESSSDDFANGREVRNIFDKIVESHVNRVSGDNDNSDDSEFQTLKEEDLLNIRDY
jgi:AAA+ superfamily predicted ATPase